MFFDPLGLHLDNLDFYTIQDVFVRTLLFSKGLLSQLVEIDDLEI